MAVFHKNRCLSIRFYVQNAQNGTSLRGTVSFDVFWEKNPCQNCTKFYTGEISRMQSPMQILGSIG